MPKPLFKIDPGSIVKGTQDGHLYCTTTPEHPEAMKLKDRKKRYVYLHRVMMENSLGRLIDTKKEEVHHKDEDPSNNAISNLKITSKGEHARGHAKKKKFWKESPRTKARKVAEAFILDRC